jgi:CheY-like chemotaxis protein
LAGGIAHDFNNLLMAAMGNLELASEEIPPDSPARESIESAQAATRRAADLTRQMLAYSGRAQFVVDEIDLNRLVSENVQMFRTAIARNITMLVELADRPVVMRGDESQIQQVVMNLITNASEAIGESAGEVRIATGVTQCDAAYLAQSHTNQKPEAGEFGFIEVTDTGCGMDAATIARLFEPFYTTKFTGRGLGMASVLGVVQGHGGAILVSSKPTVGTVMRVLFPCMAAPVPAAAPGTVPERGTGESPGYRVPTILVVDDDDLIRSLCARMVRSFGYEALTAADGNEGVALLQAHRERIDCVLLDLAMPNKNGADTLREMRMSVPSVPVIVCTGYADGAAQTGLSEQELDGFLQKPYQLEALRTTLESTLQKRKRIPES